VYVKVIFEKYYKMSENKKCRKYSIEYLKFGFIVSPTNEKLPLCPL